MSWKSIAVPLMVIVAGTAIIVLILTAPDQSSTTGVGGRSVAFQDDRPCSEYPIEGEDLPDRCKEKTPAYPDQATAATTSPTSGTATVTGTGTTTTTAITPEATSPTVATAPPTTQTAPSTEPSPEDTSTPETNDPEAITPEATPTSALTCAPGERVLITGQGPPRAAFLLYFGQRVVGGGSVSLNGSFSIPLVVGRERPGSYPVIVRVRGSEQVLRELTCEVPPAAAPTPIENE